MANNPKSTTGGEFDNTRDGFTPHSAVATTGFNFQDADPPTPLYIGVDDSLFIQCAASGPAQIVNFNLRILRPDGTIVPLQFAQATFGNRSLFGTRFQLMEGYLLSASAVPTTQMNTGTYVYATASIVRTPFGSAQSYHQLFAGYCNSFMPLSWGTSSYQRPTDGAGMPNRQIGTAPAAGADITFVVPAGARFRVISFQASLTTSAAVANRQVSLFVDDGAGTVFAVEQAFSQVASNSMSYVWADSSLVLTVNPPPINSFIPSNLIVTSGWRIRTVTAGIQAADQWTAPNVHVVEWLENS